MRQKNGLITIIVFSILLINICMNDLEVDVVSGNLPDEIIPPSQDDLLITFEANQTTIGQNGGVKANLTLFNNGINPVSNVQVDFGFDGEYTEFTGTYPEHQSASLINSGFGTSMFIELMLNDTITLGNVSSASVDVCIVIDGSGSMGAEIDQVKAEFLTITDNLAQQIPDLRIGAMVYGCTLFGSMYPQEAPGNYVEFTDDFDAVNDFIQSLVPDGGVEPWGDAIAFANTWDWREDIPKLFIIVGDEDCDPGHLVGVGEIGDYYNGSQLVDAVTNLKEKGIIINSVRTGPDEILENQFTWIAEYTGGVSVNLDEMQSLPEPIDLPELIETWTLELAREYFVNLYANISWTENDPMGDVDYETQVSLYIIVDLAPPTIAVSTLVTIKDDLNYQLDVYVTPEDLSGIISAILYWTDDDLDVPPDPTWHFEILTDKVDNTYLHSFTSLNEGDKISFYVIAIDSVGNLGETVIFNETISINAKELGTTTPLFFLEDNSTTLIYFNLALETIGYLWVETDDEVEVEILSIDFVTQELISELDFNIYKITKTGSD
ncbi:MAG: VWA domain-containing protein, partial [Asgard group archaeon]|nr:VWA domain-containing protein [Asgard group archaeon]